MKHLANFLQNEMARLEKLKEFDISSWKAPDLKEVESFFDRILKTLLTSLLFFFVRTAGRWKFFECLLLTSLNKISRYKIIIYYLLLLLFIYYYLLYILFIYLLF